LDTCVGDFTRNPRGCRPSRFLETSFAEKNKIENLRTIPSCSFHTAGIHQDTLLVKQIITMFGRSHKTKVKNVSDANVSTTKSDEEDWEVVKPTAANAKVKVSGASITIVSTQTGREVSENEKGGSKNGILDSPTLVKEVDATTKKKNGSDCMAAGDVTPIVQLQDLLASVNTSLIAEQGTKSCYVVKRNLKTVALLFLLGVFCVNKFPGQRSKRELIWSSPPEATVAHGNQTTEYELLFQQLRAELEQLEENNRHLSMAIFERNHWRTLAVSCDHDLRELSLSHSRLEEEVKQSKWLAPVAFVSPVPPRVNATAIAATPYVEYEDLPVPEPSPARRIPYPQLALPEPEPMDFPPKPSIKTGREKPYSALVLAPSVAVAAV
jgi:hypothetical protein